MITTCSLYGYSDYAVKLMDYCRTSGLVSDKLCNEWFSKYIRIIGKKIDKQGGKLCDLKRILARILNHREETPQVALSRDIIANRFYDDDDSRDSR
jgi:hypothetical protein